MKYRYRITSEGTVEADHPQGAEDAAYELLAGLLIGEHVGVLVCEVEPLREANEA